MNTLKGHNDEIEFLCHRQCFLTSPNTKQLLVKKGRSLFVRRG